MATAADCIQAIDNAFGGLAPQIVSALPARVGFAFQAYVCTKVGQQLASRKTWSWVHPQNTPTFARTNGSTMASTLANLSHLRHVDGEQVLVQELTVAGKSTAPHDLDLIKAEHFGLFEEQSAYPLWLCGPMIECKNYGSGVSMDVARELVALALDLGYLRWPLRHRGNLLSAHSVTSNAQTLARGYNTNVLSNTAPGQPEDWVESIADELER